MTGKNTGMLDEKTLKILLGGGSLLGAAGASASPVPGGFDMPDAGKVREGLAIQRETQPDVISPNAILEELLGFMAPTTMGDATMDSYLRGQTR